MSDSDNLIDERIGKGFYDEDKENRLNFVKKVYAIIGTQLVITSLICAIPMASESANKWMTVNWWLALVAMIVAIIVDIALICARRLA